MYYYKNNTSSCETKILPSSSKIYTTLFTMAKHKINLAVCTHQNIASILDEIYWISIKNNALETKKLRNCYRCGCNTKT